MSLKKTFFRGLRRAAGTGGSGPGGRHQGPRDVGLGTTGGGTTTIDLAQYPIQQIFGAPVSGDPVVSLIGESLGAGLRPRRLQHHHPPAQQHHDRYLGQRHRAALSGGVCAC